MSTLRRCPPSNQRYNHGVDPKIKHFTCERDFPGKVFNFVEIELQNNFFGASMFCKNLFVANVLYLIFRYNWCPSQVHFRANLIVYLLTLARKWTFDGHQLYIEFTDYYSKNLFHKLNVLFRGLSYYFDISF